MIKSTTKIHCLYGSGGSVIRTTTFSKPLRIVVNAETEERKKENRRLNRLLRGEYESISTETINAQGTITDSL